MSTTRLPTLFAGEPFTLDDAFRTFMRPYRWETAAEMPQMVENAVASVPGVGVVTVNIVWEPTWTPDRMTDEARLVLNMW